MKLFAGSAGGRRKALYIAAKSRAECVRLANQLGYSITDYEVKNYWYTNWGDRVIGDLGQPTEPCVWVHDEELAVYQQLWPMRQLVTESTGDFKLPSQSLLIKIGSLVVHAEEYLSSDGDPFDKVAFDSLRTDSEVQAWLRQMTNAGLLPLKRKPL